MKTKILIAFCLVLALLSSAFAVTVDPVHLGVDDAVDRSNPAQEGDDKELNEDEELEYADFDIIIFADAGNVTVTNITIPSSFFTDKLTDDVEDEPLYTVSTPFPFTVGDNDSITVTVTALVPSDLDAITTSFARKEHSIPISVLSNQGTKDTAVKFYVENELELRDVELIATIDDIKCKVDEDKEKLDCGDTDIDELFPKDDFVLEFTLKNTFKSSTDLDFEEVDLTIDTDGDIDADEDSFDDDIDAGEEKSYVVDFETDDPDDGDDFEITLEAIVEDANGALHGFKHVIEGGFELPKYDIELVDVQLSPTSICQGESSEVTYEVENIGSKAQDNVRVQLVNNVLNINDVTNRIELEEEDESDNDYKGDFLIETSESTAANTYSFEFIVYYEDEDDDDATLVTRLDLTVRDCEGDDNAQTNGGQTQEPVTQTPIVVVEPTTPVVVDPVVSEPTPTATVVTAITSKKGMSSPWAIAGLVIVILIILILIGVIIAILRK